ncbi:tRNA preQ1(34) S-adenosylmethionine ribosyltransferase-isomerase QueA [Gemmatimonas sp.]|jgi:S-adenosylmethionine:tRNA ribosyltransferase-isomerase|uniref:tRNA preQ1(34) S-adenosylmethionine ribosyltransferase-isomerase QueA n=1 Tax=Gemmatimonas sp. TaxID=1962908 RepID=UPI0037C1AA3A
MTVSSDSVQVASPEGSPKGSRTSDYDYELPEARIAQHPVEPRDASRLLVVDRRSGTLTHRTFRDVLSLIPDGDALVLNTTKVFRARLLGHRESGGPAEILLLRPVEHGAPGTYYEAMIHPGGKLRPGRTVTIADGFTVEIMDTTPRRTRIVKLHTTGHPLEAIETHGHVPLPPYIERADEAGDESRYQTVYADQAGSVAAPTAGLHFTDELIAALDAKGVERVPVLLHVGAGTFRPVSDDDPSLHVMHEEWCEVTEESAHRLNAVRARGNKIWVVGTTGVRTLETATGEDGIVRAFRGETNIFLRPLYTFRGVDHLITNFHLPKSTLVMLVAAFAGYDLTMSTYRTAVEMDYRFYSYGDAMAII